VEITGSRFVDPLTLNPVRLSPGAIAHLAAELPPSKASPLAAVLTLKAAPDAADLVALGIPHQARPSGATAKGKIYRQALETLASPELTLTLSEIGASPTPLTMKLVLGGGSAVIADVDTGGLSLSPPIPYAELIKKLARHFENTPQLSEQRAFWPAQLKVLTAMFGEENRLETQVTAAALKARFDASGVTAAEAKEALDDLVKGGLIVSRPDGSYALTENTAFWLLRMGTAVIGELTLVAHDDEGNSSPVPTELRFFGPPKDRITCITVRGEELKALAGGEPAEEVGVVCQVMDRGALIGFLETFLGVTPA
jgi:hypothetical protein